MGLCVSKKPSVETETIRIFGSLKKDKKSTSQSFRDFDIEKGTRHVLPIKGINSRLASAILLSFFDVKVTAISKSMVICKASRTYIIT